MEYSDILIKCLQLLWIEKKLKISDNNSNDLIKTTMSLIKEDSQSMGPEFEMINGLKKLIINMMSSPDGYDSISLLNTLAVIFKEKNTLYKNIEKYITTDTSEKVATSNMLTLRTSINNFYKEEKAKDTIAKIHYALVMNKTGNNTVTEYLKVALEELNTYLVASKLSDPAIVDEVDITDIDVVSNIMEKAKDTVIGTSRLKSGWHAINSMTQGGFRRGEFVLINALPHNYKSGMAQSLTMQFALHNIPILDNADKKPLILYISFEDNSDIYLGFMYRYLYIQEFGNTPDLTDITPKQMAEYIKTKLSVNGYHVKMLRVNPSLWTYRDLLNKLLEFEASGYEIHAVITDYLAKLPTTGCDKSGAQGTDLVDMFNRIRNFIGPKRILFITPHQLSTDAKSLIRNGIPEASFVKEIANKGYTEKSKQIDQVVDLEIYQHKAYINRKPHLTLFRGKHRINTILDDYKFYATLEFLPKIPIMPDIDKEPINNTKSDIENDIEDMAI